jgi:NADH:ubiquinone oxidoreductase subunit 5 (subunit L)/multisubunit Na+/H+ antiporter MnhA subunit
MDQTPNPKHQAPNPKWRPDAAVLEFGNWGFFGDWSLVFGVFILVIGAWFLVFSSRYLRHSDFGFRI